jgi:hypothetical protein
MLVALKMPIAFGKLRPPFHLLQRDHLLLVDLADDDPLEFHLDGHGGHAFANPSLEEFSRRNYSSAVHQPLADIATLTNAVSGWCLPDGLLPGPDQRMAVVAVFEHRLGVADVQRLI